MKTWTAVAAVWIGLAGPASAEPGFPGVPGETLVPGDAAWGVVFDAGVVRDSAVAGEVMAQFDEGQRAVLNERLDGVSNMLGLNLRRDLGRVVAYGRGFGPGDIGVVVEIDDADTNLEGLLLADANYDSYEYGGLIVHSVLGQQPERMRVFCAVVPRGEANPLAAGDGLGEEKFPGGVVVMSPSKEEAERLVDAARGGARAASADALGRGEFLRMWVDRLPGDFFAGQPRQSNIARMIESLEMVGTAGAADLSLSLHFDTVSVARADQLEDIAAGGKAMIEFAAAENEDAARLADLLSFVSISRPAGESRVTLRAVCRTRDVQALFDLLDEAGALDGLKLD
ncbi:MAG: hypothetical protein AAFX76_08915 [Planctomycetota bacterium]